MFSRFAGKLPSPLAFFSHLTHADGAGGSVLLPEEPELDFCPSPEPFSDDDEQDEERTQPGVFLFDVMSTAMGPSAAETKDGDGDGIESLLLSASPPTTLLFDVDDGLHAQRCMQQQQQQHDAFHGGAGRGKGRGVRAAPFPSRQQRRLAGGSRNLRRRRSSGKKKAAMSASNIVFRERRGLKTITMDSSCGTPTQQQQSACQQQQGQQHGSSSPGSMFRRHRYCAAGGSASPITDKENGGQPDGRLRHQADNDANAVARAEATAAVASLVAHPEQGYWATAERLVDDGTTIVGLCVGRRGFGHVQLLHPVPLSAIPASVHLDDIFQFRSLAFAPWSGAALSKLCPPQGQPLNAPALVSLVGVWPSTAAVVNPTEFEAVLKRRCQASNHIFHAYEPATGTWTFSLPSCSFASPPTPTPSRAHTPSSMMF